MDVAGDTGLKTYEGPWMCKGYQLLVACGKCQRKLKGENAKNLQKLKKTLKRSAKRDPEKKRFRVLTVGCLKVCPRDGVAVCTQEMLGAGRCAVLRSDDDVELLQSA